VLISVGEAAKVLGLKSRGSVYRKIQRNELDTVPGPDGNPLIERDNLEQRWAAITRARTDSPQPLRPAAQRRQSAEPPPPHAGDVPNFNDERALHEREKRLIAEMDRKVKAGQLAYIEDMEMAYNAVLLQLTTKAGSLHKQIKAAIPHLTHRELEKIERMVSDIFESVASSAFEELPE
jgi:hypothetical protein